MTGPPRRSTRADHAPGLQAVKRVARIALGFIWLYQGSVPKLFTSVPMEREIVERTGLYVHSPQATLVVIGIVEIVFGLWLISGYRERLSCATTSLFLAVLSVLVVMEEPALLIGPFGGLIKNVCLFACAWIVWRLHEED